MAMTQDEFRPLFKRGLSKVTLQAYNAVDPMWKKFFRQGDMNEYEDVRLSMAGIGRLDRFRPGQKTTPDRLTLGYYTRFFYVKYGKVIEIEEDAVQNDLYGKLVTQYAAQMGEAAVRRQEVECAKVIANGFSDVGPDGVPLFSTAHPLIAPRYGFTTWSNRSTTDAAFSYTAAKAGIIIFQKTLTEEVEPMNTRPARIINPVELEFDIQETLGASYSVENTSGNFPKMTTPNVLKGDLEQNTWLYLPSTTAWFLTAPLEKTNMFFLRRFVLQRKSTQDFDTDNFKYKATEAYSIGYDQPRGWWGSAGLNG